MQAVERRILNYWLVEELGHDRLGRVFRAEEARADRMVVLRLLRVAGVAPADRVEVARASLRRRIRAAAAVVHSSIAAVLDFTTHEDLEVLSVEDVTGESLAELAARGALLPLDEVLWHASQIAAGLEAAHSRNVTHGRISPANIRLGRDGRARLLDLGVPRPTEVAYHMAGVADGDVLESERRRDVHAFARTVQHMVTGNADPGALKDARALPGLAGSIARAVTSVVQSPQADIRSLHAALTEVARQTPADAHVAERPLPRPPVRARNVGRGTPTRPVVLAASAPAPESPPVAAAPSPPSPEPSPVPVPPPVAAPSGRPVIPPANGWPLGNRSRESPIPAKDVGIFVPEIRRHRRSLTSRWAGALRQKRLDIARSFGRLKTASSVQFAASALAGAALVIVGLGVVRVSSRDGSARSSVPPASELVAPSADPGADGRDEPASPPPPAPEPVRPTAIAASPLPVEDRGAPESVAEDPAPELGSLRISVQPRGALVSLDGGPWRPAPVSFIELSPGVHRVRIRRDGYADRTETVTVRPGETTRRTFELGDGVS